MIVVNKDGAGNEMTEYFVGTSVGLYSVESLGEVLLAGGAPLWVREGGDVLQYPIVQSMAYRPQDNILLVGTHGNGMYYSQVGTPNFKPNIVTGITPIINDPSFIQESFPNPVRQELYYTVGNKLVKNILVELYTITGQKIYSMKKPYQNGRVEIDLPGIYILSITSTDNRYRYLYKFTKI